MLSRAKTIAAGLATAATIAVGSLALATSADAQPYWMYHHRYHQYPYGYGYNYGYDPGTAFAASILGAIAGKVLGNSIHPYSYGGGVSYCIQRFRTYELSSHTYMGYDGFRHYCD